jgi:hypothetical protein
MMILPERHGIIKVMTGWQIVKMKDGTAFCQGIRMETATVLQESKTVIGNMPQPAVLIMSILALKTTTRPVLEAIFA